MEMARTTNAIERLNEEFRRRIKTQTVLPCAETVPMLLWALLASGNRMRKVDGWETLLIPSNHSPLTAPPEKPNLQTPGARRQGISTTFETQPPPHANLSAGPRKKAPVRGPQFTTECTPPR